MCELTEEMYASIKIGYKSYLFPVEDGINIIKAFSTAIQVEDGYGTKYSLGHVEDTIKLTIITAQSIKEKLTEAMLEGDTEK